jgi:hypothetical protein
MVHRFTTIFTAAALAISAVTAQATSENLINGQCVQTYDASIDYFPVKLNTGKLLFFFFFFFFFFLWAWIIIF